MLLNVFCSVINLLCTKTFLNFAFLVIITIKILLKKSIGWIKVKSSAICWVWQLFWVTWSFWVNNMMCWMETFLQYCYFFTGGRCNAQNTARPLTVMLADHRNLPQLQKIWLLIWSCCFPWGLVYVLFVNVQGMGCDPICFFVLFFWTL